jgi:DNA-binding response OmpR family regulator
MDGLILIINQNEIERRYIATVLAADGFDIIQVGSVVEGMVQEMTHDPALIIVSEETSPVHIDEVIALIRRLTEAPLMVVGGGGNTGEIASLRSGGDYYLSRPFRGAELAARARLLIQRSGGEIREIPPQSAHSSEAPRSRRPGGQGRVA